MAQALRTIRLEPEEQHEQFVPQPRSLRRRRPALTVGLRIAILLVMVSGGVSLLVGFIHVYARIAAYEFQRRALVQECAQLDRECIELRLELERLSSQPRLAQVADARGFEFPNPERVHYLKVAEGYPASCLPATAQEPAPRSWIARAGEQARAALAHVCALLATGSAGPAYAQE